MITAIESMRHQTSAMYAGTDFNVAFDLQVLRVETCTVEIGMPTMATCHKCRHSLGANARAVTSHRRQVQQHRESCASLHQRSDR